MNKALRRKIIITAAAWAVALLIFFPIFWMFLTGFKTEVEAIAIPPSLFFTPTLENYVAVSAPTTSSSSGTASTSRSARRFWRS